LTRYNKVRTNAELAAVIAKLDEIPINPNTKQPTFTLISLEISGTDLPDLLRWKLDCK